MWRVGEMWRRVIVLVRGGRFDRELEEEMRLHLDLAAEEHRHAGMDADQAERAARRRFGNPLWLRERSADVWGWTALEQAWRDLCVAARSLRRSRGFAVITIVTLSVGIGVNTAVFSVVNGLLLRPLPYPDQERLVRLDASMPGRAMMSVSLPDFVDWRDQGGVFDVMGAYRRTSAALSGSGEPQQLAGALATADLFAVLGVVPAAGRLLAQDDGTPGGEPVVVLGHALWQRQFGSDPSVIGGTVVLDGERRTVVGVTSPGFDFPAASQFWVPIATGPSPWERSNHMFAVVGRLKRGVGLTEARARMAVLSSRLAEAYPESNRDVQATLLPLRDDLVGRTGALFIGFQLAVGLVLLVICANVANLVLARSVARRREMAVRQALGASRRRVARLLFCETAILVALGAVAGLAISKVAMVAWLSSAAGQVPSWMRFEADGRVAAFVLAVTTVTMVVLTLVPLLQFVRTEPTAMLREGMASAGAAARRLRSALAVAEVALAQVLLVGASVVVISLVRLVEVDPGFRADSVLTFRVSLPAGTYGTPERTSAFIGDLVAGLETIPGVRGAAAVMSLPLSGRDWGRSYRVEGLQETSAGEALQGIEQVVSPGYFGVMGVPLLRGRDFTPRDRLPGSPPVVIVNRAMADRDWPGQDPIGKRIRLGLDEAWTTVVGVAGDVLHHGLDQPVREGFFVPHAQEPMQRMSIVVRAETEPSELVDAARRRVWALDPGLPLTEVQTMAAVVDRQLFQRRQAARLLGALGLAAVLLAWLGVYGVIADGVSRRTREIGIRVALGASGSDVRRMVVFEGTKLAGIGVLLGLVAAVALAVVLSSLVGVAGSALAPILAATTAGVLGVAALGCYVPARRAANIDPVIALHEE